MFAKCGWLAWLATMVCANGHSSSEIPGAPSSLRLLAVHDSGLDSPRNEWPHSGQGNVRLQEDSRRLTAEGISHAYASHSLGSSPAATGSYSERPIQSFSSQEYWSPGVSGTNYTGIKFYAYPRPHLAAEGASYRNAARGSHSALQYHHLRGTATKKVPPYVFKGKPQVQGAEVPGTPDAPKYKKTGFHHVPANYNKAIYPRVHKPHAKHKYPTVKTAHPFYKRYYRSPYQQYAIPSTEMLRQRTKAQFFEGLGYRTVSAAAPTPASDRYHTTERMDDAYPDGQTTSEDYSAYNDTYGRPNANYYDGYEEVEKASSESEENSHDENTTRGYYGDRIYMSAQVPDKVPDKAATSSKYFLVRRTSTGDDIETIFE